MSPSPGWALTQPSADRYLPVAGRS